MNARTRRGFAILGSAAALGAVSTASAAQTSYTNLSAAKTSAECGTVATASVFSRWGDTALYAPAIGGNMEPESQASWFLLGASFIAGNESFYLGGRSHKYSLRLPPSTLANAPWLCVGAELPDRPFRRAKHRSAQRPARHRRPVLRRSPGRRRQCPPGRHRRHVEVGSLAADPAVAPDRSHPLPHQLLEHGRRGLPDGRPLHRPDATLGLAPHSRGRARFSGAQDHEDLAGPVANRGDRAMSSPVRRAEASRRRSPGPPSNGRTRHVAGGTPRSPSCERACSTRPSGRPRRAG